RPAGDRRRRIRAGRGATGGDRRRNHHRAGRRAPVHRDSATAEGEGAVTSTAVLAGIRRRTARRRVAIGALAVTVVAAFATSLMVGHTFYPPGDVLDVLLGRTVPGASFTVGRLRLPRAVLAVAAG